MIFEFLNALWPVCAFAVLLMVAIWLLALRMDNMGIVDIAWSAAFAPVAIYYAAFGHGFSQRRWLLAGMAAVWSLRLGLHLYIRVMGHHPHEDVRYAKMREKWGAGLKAQSLVFFQAQAVLIVLLTIPFYIVCRNDFPALHTVELAGVAMWLIAVLGESVADWQLKSFRANPANKGKICQSGLWNHSRHPNYFFEWLIWVAFFVFALGSPFGIVAIYCPALMLFFLLRVTGIPLTEELSLRSKGDAYREYQRTTSAFVPWFRRGQTKTAGG